MDEWMDEEWMNEWKRESQKQLYEKKHDKTKYHAYVRSVDCETSSCREGDKGSVNTNAADWRVTWWLADFRMTFDV